MAGVAVAVSARHYAVPTDSAYIGSQSCTACHRDQVEAWSYSDHANAMHEATDASVLGDFGDTTFTAFGVTSRFFRRDGKFVVNTEGPDGQMRDYEVTYTFGWKPLQQYLVEFPGGRKQCLPIAWDTVEKRWFHLYPKERIAPGDSLFWTGRLQNWNFMCAECHSTNLHKGYDDTADVFRTTWSEINVACETCHGPASSHVTIEQSRWRKWFASSDGLTVRLKDADAPTVLNACAMCHSRRHQIEDPNEHGKPFMDFYVPQLLTEGVYHPDGQILEEDYEFSSYTQSKMFNVGVRCNDCHDPHSLSVKARGNQLCTRCHDAGTYDAPSHHFHKPDSAGAACVECHMPVTKYMVVDPRRDHSIRIPRPDLSVALDVPNACTMCHADQTARWAADAVVRWYGPERPGPLPFATAFARAEAGGSDVDRFLIGLVTDPDRPAIVRASAAYYLRLSQGPDAIAALERALSDPDPMVRQTAIGGLDGLDATERVAKLAPLLADPLRAVRVEAARVLSNVPRRLLTAEQAARFDAAIADYVHGQLAQGDQPGSHLNLGVLYENLGQTGRAESEYRKAIDRDPSFVQAMMNLARLLDGTGRVDEAEAQLRRAIVVAPEMGEAHYSLGLVLAERAERDPAFRAESAHELRLAADRLSNQARVQYNTGLAFERAGDEAEAERYLLRAVHLDPVGVDALVALGTHHAHRGQWDKAMAYAQQAAEIDPDSKVVRALIAAVAARRVPGM